MRDLDFLEPTKLLVPIRWPLAAAVPALLLGNLWAAGADARDFPAALNLSSLNGSNGFRLDGEAADDQAGFAVSATGDINGDGIDDLLIGAPAQLVGGAGTSYVVFGRSTSFPAVLNLSDLDGSNGFRIDGLTGENSGLSVSAAGDINGDGIDDLVIGAPLASPGGIFWAGSSYVVFGRASGFGPVLSLSSLDGNTGFRLDGVAGFDRSGHSVAAAGDINNDGIDDLIIGAFGASPGSVNQAGSSYVVFGRDTDFDAVLALSSLDGSIGFRIDGTASGGRAGASVSGAGDLNGDGIDDLLIGAPAQQNGGPGTSYVVFGRSTSFPAVLSLSALDGSNGFSIFSTEESDLAGDSVSAAGDINGDGIDDLVIGASEADPNGRNNAGSAYVVFGRNSGFGALLDLSSLNGSTGFRMDGVASGDRFGRSVSAAGDVNGDGIDDLIVGAELASPDGNPSAGSSYVVFGRRTGFNAVLALSSLDGTTGFRIDGAATGGGAGAAVSAAGDINNDGFNDLIIGAPSADPNGNRNAGSSYILFGVGVLDPVFADRFEPAL